VVAELADYRNYDSLVLQFDRGTNILYGDNAQGKTNILEAIYVAATTIQLAQFHIYKSSPLRGTIFNDSQVFRRKKHNITKPQKIRCFLDLLAIYGNL